MESTDIAPSTEALEQKATDVLARAKALVVDSPAADAAAVEFLRGVKLVTTEIESAMAPIKFIPAAAPSSAPSTTTWSAEVTDLFALVVYVAGHPEEIGLLIANGPALNKRAVASKAAMAIPGVAARAKTGLTLRAER